LSHHNEIVPVTYSSVCDRLFTCAASYGHVVHLLWPTAKSVVKLQCSWFIQVHLKQKKYDFVLEVKQ